MAPHEPPPRMRPPPRLVRATAPVARVLAGRRWFPLWAVVHHVGRRTGRAYAVPVAVLVTRTTFVIGLPWGERTNWAQNVLAEDGCILTWKGRDRPVTAPRLVGRDVAVASAGRLQRPLVKRLPIDAYLQLQR